MKNIKKYIGIIILVFAMSTLFAQTPPPPNNDNTSSGGTTPVGGGAPIGNDIAILITISISYAIVRHYKNQQTNKGLYFDSK
ncbi:MULTISPECIES: hypothetical protein [unclassified Lentimicrobium]|uniref:hypothetical protein n=1 Tax=unclassified Lentimicrobium TaxID=2677434 RepID=UPI0015520D90|nr:MULTISPECIES: hypothetical protein [unclassified Lentimicrobium]NPD48001.1 hypothetical protein [Lentimicrobium sp. S6]NPD86632.1 hypothetical protein [Lentimicrobium sp. L6]